MCATSRELFAAKRNTASIIALETRSSEEAAMFLKDQDLEKQAGFAEPAEEEYRELADEELDAIAGGEFGSEGLIQKTCADCGTKLPHGWQGNFCLSCERAHESPQLL